MMDRSYAPCSGRLCNIDHSIKETGASVLLTIPPSRAGVFAAGCVLVAIGEAIVETRPEDFNHRLTLGRLIVAGGA
jgi:hypothetical protein